MISEQVARQFIEKLRHLESTGDAEPLLKLFAPDCSLSNLIHSLDFKALEGAKRFWSEYCHAFREVHSDFTRVQMAGSLATLEWESNGLLRSGAPFRYRGVSILEIKDGRICRFKSYYDSAALRHAA